MIKEISKTDLDGVLLIELDSFKDFRGFYQETYNKEEYKKNKIEVDFLQDDISVSNHKVLRGLHGDNRTWKLVSCLHGEFFLVVVNFDSNSNQYCKYKTFTLNENDNFQILIPPMFANGHLVMSEKTIFHYKQSTYYEGMGKQFTLKWDDPKINIKWPIQDPILSKRDSEVTYID